MRHLGLPLSQAALETVAQHSQLIHVACAAADDMEPAWLLLSLLHLACISLPVCTVSSAAFELLALLPGLIDLWADGLKVCGTEQLSALTSLHLGSEPLLQTPAGMQAAASGRWVGPAAALLPALRTLVCQAGSRFVLKDLQGYAGLRELHLGLGLPRAAGAAACWAA
jgi:hypothetical protein